MVSAPTIKSIKILAGPILVINTSMRTIRSLQPFFSTLSSLYLPSFYLILAYIMSTSSLEPCQICPTHIPCSTFDVDVDSGRMVVFLLFFSPSNLNLIHFFLQNTCFCGHFREDHCPAFATTSCVPRAWGTS